MSASTKTDNIRNHAVPEPVRSLGAGIAWMGRFKAFQEHAAVDAVQKHVRAVEQDRRGRRDRRPGEKRATSTVRGAHAFPRRGHVRGRRSSVRVVSPGYRCGGPVRPAGRARRSPAGYQREFAAC